MKNTIINRALSLVVLSTFLLNDICFGLGVQPGSTQAPIKDAMYALGRKLIATKVGPGSIDWDKCPPGSFVGNGQVPGAEFINADYSNPPAGWANNPILQKTNLIDAFKYFRDNEAKIPPEFLDIREGFFDVDAEKGELPISRLEASIEQGRIKYTLIVHTEFVQIWNHIRQNDVWYKPENSDRVRSVAWGIFYRVAKHEMTDLRKNGSKIKSAGHIGFSFGGLQIEEDEAAANGIKGQYSVTNDAIWMWFLASYAFANTTRYNNETLSERIKWLCLGDGRQYIKGEFPLTWDQSHETLGEKRVLKPMTDLACGINYHFFSTGRSVPEFEIDQTFVEEYMERAGKIVRNLYATGSGEQLNKDKVLAALQALQIARKKETTLAELAKNTGLQAHEVRSVIILINKELPVKEKFMLLSGGQVIIPAAAKVRETAETKLLYGKNGGMRAVDIVGGELDGVYVEINPANGRAVVYKNKGGPALRPIDPVRCNKAMELIKADLAARKAAATAAKETPASLDASAPAPTVPSPMPQDGEKPEHRDVLGTTGRGYTTGIGQTPTQNEASGSADQKIQPVVDDSIEVLDYYDEGGNVVGTLPKSEIHAKRLLHKHMQCFVVNSKGQLLLQQRAKSEDNPLLWDKSIGGHVKAAEPMDECLVREFVEELHGNVPLSSAISVTNVGERRFISNRLKKDSSGYKQESLIISAYVTLYDGDIVKGPDVNDTRWVMREELEGWLKSRPGDFTNDFKELYALYANKIFPPLSSDAKPGEAQVLGKSGHGDTTGKGPTRGEGDFIAGRKAPLDQAARLRELMADRKGPPVIQIISEYIISLGLDKGPGAEKLSANELEIIYKSVAFLKDSKVELIVPQSLKFTNAMKRAIKEIGKRE
ncbi:MAG: NUDIX domain-containing protein, partial [Candidatus Omnitrophica bacterium]|nr:NUDIX domain-containing protein [Candidatus Omnitrophota bacterium]